MDATKPHPLHQPPPKTTTTTIKRSFPSYTDCHLRLAAIAAAAGDAPAAVAWANRAIAAATGGADGANGAAGAATPGGAAAAADARAFLASFHLERGELDLAKKAIDAILLAPSPANQQQQQRGPGAAGADRKGGAGGAGGGGASDAYAKLALAALYLKSMPLGKAPEQRQKARANLERVSLLERLERLVLWMSWLRRGRSAAAEAARGAQGRGDDRAQRPATQHNSLAPTSHHQHPIQKIQKISKRQAQAIYRSVLKVQPANLFAANGLGVCLAEAGHVGAAK